MTAMTPCLDRPGYLPRVSSHHLSRPRLTEPLLLSTARVKLLCAPPGSGKSALLAECLLQVPADGQVLWLPLHGASLSAADFCSRLAQALQLPSTDEPELLATLSHLQASTWVFLDDYCRTPAPELDALLDRLIAVSSPALTWWLSARRRPQCNWPRLLLDDELYEVEGRALAFNQPEVEQLLGHLEPALVEKTARRVVQRSGGWCAAVRIALLDGCQWGRDEARQARSATLLDYLQHELFNTLPPELADAWQVLAHLPRFNASLCEHLFGAGDGARWMLDLQARGCFIESWEDSPDWLHVFAPLARLIKEQPWPTGRSWHRRACQWFCAEQDWQAAFEQALLAEEFDVAVSLLQHFSVEQVLQRQNARLLLGLYEQQGADLLLGSPQLIGLVTAALLFAGRFDQAGACLDQLSRFLPQPTADAQSQLIARWQAQRGWLLHLQGRMSAARALFLEALDTLDAEAWPARLLCWSGMTQQALLEGDLDGAQGINRQALCLARAQDSLLFEAWLELDHAQLLEQRGAAPRADNLLANVQQLLEQRTDRPVPLLGRIALRRGRLALSQGHDGQAARLFESGLDDCRRSHDKRVLYGYLGLAQLAANQRDYAQAFVYLRDAERLMQQRQIPDTVYRGVLLQTSSHFWLQQGRPELAHEALSRVLKHYRGPTARQAPPATLELIARIEYLLVLAETHLHGGSDAANRLHRWRENAARRGRMNLEAELLFALAEVLAFEGHASGATATWQAGLDLVSRYHLRQALREAELRLPPALRWLIREDGPMDEVCPSPADHSLSQRELEVLELIARGNSNQQIAEQLFISLHTVKTHARRIHGKLGVERRTQAVDKARGLGLIT